MKLVEKGLIDLDAPVETYLTRWHLPPSEFNHNEVTIRRLLSNSSGLSGSGYSCINPNLYSFKIKEKLSGIKRTLDNNELNYCRKWDLDPTVEESPVKVIQPPGQKFLYSNRGFTVLQLIIEEVTNRYFEDFMEKEIIRPLGMSSSSYDLNTIDISFLATPYDEDGNPLPNYRTMEIAAGGFLSSIKDLYSFSSTLELI